MVCACGASVRGAGAGARFEVDGAEPLAGGAGFASPGLGGGVVLTGVGSVASTTTSSAVCPTDALARSSGAVQLIPTPVVAPNDCRLRHLEATTTSRSYPWRIRPARVGMPHPETVCFSTETSASAPSDSAIFARTCERYELRLSRSAVNCLKL